MEILSGDDVLEAQTHIWNQIFIFTKSMALKCVVQLGIPDILHRHGPNPMPLSQLVSALELHPNKTPYIYRLMCVLVHSGFFLTRKLSEQNGEEEDHGYVLTNSSRLLVTTNPLTQVPFVSSTLQTYHFKSWRSILTWLKSEDRTPFHTAHGVSLWEYMDSETTDDDLDGRTIFNTSMESDSNFVMSVLLEKCKGVFDGVRSLVDVGGGTGNMAKAIAQAFPKIECIVLDLPQVVNNLKGELGNLKYVGGDMFEAIPPADTLLLKWIIHDWSEEESVKILKKCKEAIKRNGNKGKVIAIDMVVGNEKRDELIETQLLFDMMMMLVTGGKERDEKEWAHLIEEAGFSGYNIFPFLGSRSLIEIYP